MTRLCSFPECTRLSRARELCHKHYKQKYYKRSEYDRLYDIWKQMISRCYDKDNVSYIRYGNRGIKVCDRWRKGLKPYMTFIKDMGTRPDSSYSLERKNNNGDYEPSNCKWATREEQSRNTRDNKFLTYRGQTKCITDWAKEVNINRMTITSRIKRGWSIERALTTKP